VQWSAKKFAPDSSSLLVFLPLTTETFHALPSCPSFLTTYNLRARTTEQIHSIRATTVAPSFDFNRWLWTTQNIKVTIFYGIYWCRKDGSDTVVADGQLAWYPSVDYARALRFTQQQHKVSRKQHLMDFEATILKSIMTSKIFNKRIQSSSENHWRHALYYTNNHLYLYRRQIYSNLFRTPGTCLHFFFSFFLRSTIQEIGRRLETRKPNNV